METLCVGPVTYPAGFPGLRIDMDPKERFYRHFEAQVTGLQDEVANLINISSAGGERKDALDRVLEGISKLTSEVSDAADYVPPRDQMIYTKALAALREQLNDQVSKLSPRGRFAFKPRISGAAGADKAAAADPLRPLQNIPDTDSSAVVDDDQVEKDAVGDLPSFANKNYNAELAKDGGSGIRKPSFSAARDISISDHTDLHIILPPTAARATAYGSLTNLRGCIVDMSTPTANGTPFASLVLRDISNSLIVAGHVAGPLHITGVTDSVVVANARQVRMHECKNVDIYLYCTSHPIIEDCTNMRFATLPSCYISREENMGNNQWDQVDDFKWLKAEHSPNWKILPESERVPEDVWKNAVPGGPSHGREEILRKVGAL